jgi:hypothetical protein
MTVLYFGKTISGQPGKSFRWSLNLYPYRCNQDLTAFSGFVSLPFIRDIKAERRSGVKRSAMSIRRRTR